MVDNFDPHISIKSVTLADDHSEYVVKEYSDFGDFQNIISPLKAMDMRGLSRETAELYSFDSKLRIIEQSHYVGSARSWNAIDRMIEGELKFARMLYLKTSLFEEIPNTIAFPSVVFSYDPFKTRFVPSLDKEKSTKKKKVWKVITYPPFDKNDFESFLQNLYAYSKGMILVPDIIMKHVRAVPDKIPPKTQTCTVEDYIKNIEYFMSVLSERNKKPIFVPIQANIPIKWIKEILSHYKKEGYSNIWIDFTGGAVHHQRLAGLRMILNALDERFGKEKYVVYYSHMKKEIHSHILEEKSPASDMLTQFVEADIIGANRGPTGGPMDDEQKEQQMEQLDASTEEELKNMKLLHRSRIFDPISYYYYFPSKHPSLGNKGKTDDLLGYARNKATDSRIKVLEIENVKKICDENKKIRPYMKKKEMLREKEEIYQEIFEERTKTKSILDF